MSLRPEIFLLIIGCLLVTIIPRTLPMMLLGRVRPPDWFLQWLRFIPTAVISALLFKDILLQQGQWRDIADPYLLSGIAALILAFVSRHIFITVIGGAVFFYALRFYL